MDVAPHPRSELQPVRSREAQAHERGPCTVEGVTALQWPTHTAMRQRNPRPVKPAPFRQSKPAGLSQQRVESSTSIRTAAASRIRKTAGSVCTCRSKDGSSRNKHPRVCCDFEGVFMVLRWHIRPPALKAAAPTPLRGLPQGAHRLPVETA